MQLMILVLRNHYNEGPSAPKKTKYEILRQTPCSLGHEVDIALSGPRKTYKI